MWYKNIHRYVIWAIVLAGAPWFLWLLTRDIVAQPPVYPERNLADPAIPMIPPLQNTSALSRIDQQYRYPPDHFAADNDFGAFDFSSLLGIKMPANGLELLIVIAIYGFRYLSLVQKRLKDGDETLLTRIDANEIRQNEELAKLIETITSLRTEIREDNITLNQKIDIVSSRFPL
jgi:hypothetical protein